MKKKGKIIKMFLPIFLSVMLIFNAAIPPKKTQAVAPILIWAAEALIAEVVIDLGWKYVGKPALKKLTKKISKKIMDNPNAFDFMKKKPKIDGKKKSIDVDISPLDRAKIASMVKEESKTIKAKDKDNHEKWTTPSYDVDFGNTDPFYNTGVKLNIYPDTSYGNLLRNQEALHFYKKLIHFKFIPNAYKASSNLELISSLDNRVVCTQTLSGGTPYRVHDVKARYLTNTSGDEYYLNFFSTGCSMNPKTPEVKVFKSYLRALELANTTIYLAEGVMVPEDNTRVYDVPMSTPSGTKLPNHNDLDIDLSIPIDIDNENILEVEWEDLDIYQNYFEQYVTNVENKGDVTINNYENITYVTNIYYQSDPYDKTPEEVCKEINCDGETNPPTDPEEEDDGSIWKDIIPIALIIVLFDLLSSILMYLARMFQFILTIPVIPEKTIDNSAFQWFKTAKIMGVQIYNVVSMLATVGLSFLAFKAIRKVLP